MPLVILVFGVIVAVIAACNRSARYNARLTSADSLMWDTPDSALAILSTIDSLATEGDRAYRDLLLTQARYRCYVTTTSDSDINRALAYYRAHPKEREKLTRANIFKGAVMDELGFPDSAMLYYKQAEAVADTADYFNLGYAVMRIGALYQENHVLDGKDIVCYEKALQYFNKTEKITYQLMCLVNLGSLYCLTAPHKADSLLKKSLSVAETIGDTSRYILAVENLIKNDIHQRTYEDAHPLVQKVMSMNTQFLGATFYLFAANVYACLGMPDSAEILLAMAESKTISTDIQRLTYLDDKRDIARARGDIEASQYYDQLGDRLEDSLLSLDTPFKITSMEDSTVEQSHHTMKKKHESLVWKILLLCLAMLAVLALIAAALIYRNKHRYSQLINDLMEESQNHVSDINTLRRNIDQLKIRDSQLKDFITSYIELMGDVTEACYHSPKNVLSNEISRLFQIKEENKDRWVELYSYIDNEYNQIITDTINKYNQLNDRDILLLALTCLDFSCAQIAIITGYSNATSISGNRQRLAKKMGLDHSLQEYINQYKSPQEAN